MMWLKGHERLVLGVAAALQVGVVLVLIASRLAVLWSGETVLLRVVPVDPRDLFRGDYVILGYDFSRVPPGHIKGLAAAEGQDAVSGPGRTVYISLVPDADGQHWHSGEVSLQRPAGGKFLRGTLTNFGRVECGIESYYVQEGKGQAYEQAIRQGRLYAEVAVSPTGGAILRRLRIE
jgi:uncharacterized membrane-anchored protein